MSLVVINQGKFRDKIPSLAAHVGGIAADIASCTDDNEFDDIAADMLPGVVESLLLKFVNAPQPMMVTEAAVGEHFNKEFAANGKIITPERLKILFDLLKVFLPAIG